LINRNQHLFTKCIKIHYFLLDKHTFIGYAFLMKAKEVKHYINLNKSKKDKKIQKIIKILEKLRNYPEESTRIAYLIIILRKLEKENLLKTKTKKSNKK